MATVITELSTESAEQEQTKTYNVTATDVSAGADLLTAIEDYRYGIKSITITGDFGAGEWFKILDGSNILIGPVPMGENVPWSHKFDDIVYGNQDNALILQTSDAIVMHMIIRVAVSLPYPSSSPSASPSA